MIEYIYNPTLWAIVGVILVLLELSDGSKIFFLPLGLASISTGIIVYLQNTGSLNELILLKYWHSPLLSLAALALFYAFILRLFSSSLKNDDNSDINEY